MLLIRTHAGCVIDVSGHFGDGVGKDILANTLQSSPYP